jgi:diaminopimelate epimerase
MHFVKYQATGNDFIILDNRSGTFNKSDHQFISSLCHRRFGIGADGLMLLESMPGFDFRMVYFNADGHEGSMCGNGGRCITAFAAGLSNQKSSFHFSAFDGPHQAEVLSENSGNFLIRLQMSDVKLPQQAGNDWVLNTGSPHFIRFVEDVNSVDVRVKGSQIRNSETYLKDGINVNFVQVLNKEEIFVRTYERGVEDETLSCGTGVTAAAITSFAAGLTNQSVIQVKTPGGALKVSFAPKAGSFSNVMLEGSAIRVFEGEI